MKWLMSYIVMILIIFCGCQTVNNHQSGSTAQQLQSELSSQNAFRIPSSTQIEVYKSAGFVEIDKLVKNKSTVCTMTLNSNEEALTFRKQLSQEDFQFVELNTGKANWLSNAARAKVSCDILIISGHFGGKFFGKNGDLSLEELENQSCQEDASGIFHHAKEVFLFGCNTLAGKSHDTRTPEEYQQVLIRDGFTPNEAVQVAAYRYSPAGKTFSDRMANLFANSQRIYGFSSPAPLGQSLAPMLKNYLSKIKNYHTYLKNLSAAPNLELTAALRSTSLVQIAGRSDYNKDIIPRCFLKNKQVSEAKKWDWIYQNLKNSEQRMLYLDEISNFIFKQRIGSSRVHELQITRELVSDQNLKKEMLNLINRGLADYPSYRFKLLGLASYFGWYSEAERMKTTLEVVNPYLKSPTLSETNLTNLCQIGDTLANLISAKSLQYLKKDLNYYSFLQCIHTQDAQIILATINDYNNERNQEIRLKIIDLLSKASVEKQSVYNFFTEILNKSTNSVEKAQALYYFSSNLTPEEISAIFLQTFERDDDELVNSTILSKYVENPSLQPSEETLLRILKTAQNSSKKKTLLYLLGKIRLSNNESIRFVINLLYNDSDPVVRTAAANTLASNQLSPENTQIFARSTLLEKDEITFDAILASFEYVTSNKQIIADQIIYLMDNKVFESHFTQELDSLVSLHIKSPSVFTKLNSLYSSNSSDEIKLNALRSMADFVDNKQYVANLLLSRLKDTNNTNNLIQVLKIIARKKFDTPDSNFQIVNLMKTHPNEDIRSSAAGTLGEIATSDPLVINSLAYCLKSEQSLAVLSSCSLAIQRIGLYNPEIILQLIKLSKENRSFNLSQSVNETLLSFSDSSETSSKYLKNLITTTNNVDIRNDVLRSCINYSNLSNELVEYFLSMTSNNADSDLRAMAASILLQQDKLSAEVGHSLIQAFKNEIDPDIRTTIVYTLKNITPMNSQVLQTLRDIRYSDYSVTVRITAKNILQEILEQNK